MPKVSVIIPVYNVEKYLVQCLESIKNQTLTDIEVICINDGSTDLSLEILTNFAQNDNRFIIINKKNEGQGIARNYGIEKAGGEFLIFVDSDDWLEENALELCYNKIKNDNSDILFFNNYKYFEKSNQKSKNDYISIYKGFWEKPFTKEDAKNNIFLGNALTFKMYKTNFIRNNNIRYSSHRFMEDMIFYYKSIFLSTRLSCLNEYVYNYRIHTSSYTYNIKEQLKCMPEVYDLCFNLLEELNISQELMNAFIESRKKSLLYFYKQAPKTQKAKYYKMMQKIVKKYLVQYGLDNEFTYISKHSYLQYCFYKKFEKTKIVLKSHFI